MNKCICIKSPINSKPRRYAASIPTKNGSEKAVEKGDTFTYFLNYDGNEGFGPPVKVELYDVNTGRHRFSIGKITFDEYFADIIEFREKQIEKILE